MWERIQLRSDGFMKAHEWIFRLSRGSGTWMARCTYEKPLLVCVVVVIPLE